MNQTPLYTEYHPRWYRQRVSTWWWLRRGAYLAFILREVSSAFIAWFVVFTLLSVRALSQGAASWNDFLAWARHPLVLLLNVVTLFFVVFHAATWFNLAPKAMVVRFRGQRVPGHWILIANLAAWAVFSAIVACIVAW